MALPSWVQFEARCVCITDDWTDADTGEATGVVRPIKGERYTVMTPAELGDDGFMTLLEIADDFWEIRAFRPLTAQERDEEMFDRMLKDASALTERVLEPAL